MTVKQKWIIGIGAVGIIAYILYANKKKGSADYSNMITGRIVKDTPVLHFDGEYYNAIGSELKQGDPITIHAEKSGYYKVDCDGLYVPCDSVKLDRQFSNFIGKEEEKYYNRTGL